MTANYLTTNAFCKTRCFTEPTCHQRCVDKLSVKDTRECIAFYKAD